MELETKSNFMLFLVNCFGKQWKMQWPCDLLEVFFTEPFNDIRPVTIISKHGIVKARATDLKIKATLVWQHQKIWGIVKNKDSEPWGQLPRRWKVRVLSYARIVKRWWIVGFTQYDFTADQSSKGDTKSTRPDTPGSMATKWHTS